MELKIEYVPIDSIKPYSKNAKLHPAEQIEQIKKSIQEFGFKDAIAVWNNEVVEGHGRLLAAKELGMKELPIVRLDDLTDEQRRAYALVHNKLTMNSPFDDGILSEELENILDIDMEALGFDLLGEDEDETYTKKIDGAEYEPTGRVVDVSECYNTDKYNELVEEIEKANIDDDIKDFLRLAAGRHICFDYQTIAEYYANAPKEIQALMEKSALVIIDYDSAIKNGFTRLITDVAEIMDDET